jgi:hypothetical protein
MGSEWEGATAAEYRLRLPIRACRARRRDLDVNLKARVAV